MMGDLPVAAAVVHEALVVRRHALPHGLPVHLLRRLHVNLGHPSSDVFLRILRNGQASVWALELAREKGATMQDEIWRAWAKCKYRTYEMTTERKNEIIEDRKERK